MRGRLGIPGMEAPCFLSCSATSWALVTGMGDGSLGKHPGGGSWFVVAGSVNANVWGIRRRTVRHVILSKCRACHPWLGIRPATRKKTYADTPNIVTVCATEHYLHSFLGGQYDGKVGPQLCPHSGGVGELQMHPQEQTEAGPLLR